MIAVIGRPITRFHYQKRLLADDFVLLLGCLTLIGAFVLINIMFETIYFQMSLVLGPMELVLEESITPGFEDRILKYRQLAISSEELYWVTVFAVKISFLLFFRQMTNRLKAVMTYWKKVMWFLTFSGIFCFCSIFMFCPHWGVSASK